MKLVLIIGIRVLNTVSRQFNDMEHCVALCWQSNASPVATRFTAVGTIQFHSKENEMNYNYMNDFDIQMAQQRFAGHPVLGKAVQFLAAFKEQVDNCSDGWAYWKAPVAACNKLMKMIQGKVPATEANFKAAMSPIKSFMTRKGTAAGIQMPIIF